MAFTLPDLPYSTGVLEPHINAPTMKIHHGKHHAARIVELLAKLRGELEICEARFLSRVHQLSVSMHPIRTCLVVFALTGLAGAHCQLLAQVSTQADAPEQRLDHPNWLGPFVPTPAHVISAALELAKVGKNDLVYDLGSGDGGIILAAAQRFQARSVGIEWNRALCEQTSSAIRELGLEGRVSVIHGDIFSQDVSAATVVTGYLLPKAWERLAPFLKRQLRKGARVVSLKDPIPGWRAVREKQVQGQSRLSPWNLYLYRMR